MNEAGTAAPEQASPPTTQSTVTCDRCGRTAAKWEERDTHTALHSLDGRYALPRTHTARLCSRCLIRWEGTEAAGAVLGWLGGGLLFSYNLNWPRFQWRWDTAGPHGAAGAKLCFGLMGLGIVLFAVFGTGRWLRRRALGEREAPADPAWHPVIILPQTLDEILNSPRIDPERGPLYVRTSLDGLAGGAQPAAAATASAHAGEDGSQAGSCRRELIDFLLRDSTREFERTNDAWWSRDDLVLVLFKAGLHEADSPDEFNAAAAAAIDGLVADGLLQGTDSGYRASPKAVAPRAGPAPAAPHAGPGTCALCGATLGPDAVPILLRTGRKQGSRVTDVQRQHDLVTTTTQASYDDVLDVEARLCRRCWVDGRRSWNRSIRLVMLGIPALCILALTAIIYGVESALLGLGLVAVLVIGFLSGFVAVVKRFQENHPMPRLQRRVAAARNAREHTSDAIVICTTWPPPSKGSWLESGY
ncbi:MAG: hypothetical protein FIB01_11475 [Gemmatimonadetes bacterium]|nr:hypothetical protein [Gemmatimonadota bacterium]